MIARIGIANGIGPRPHSAAFRSQETVNFSLGRRTCGRTSPASTLLIIAHGHRAGIFLTGRIS